MTTVYIVLGTTGEYADREQWNVCFKETEEEARKVRDLCQKQADEYCLWKKRRPSKSFMRRLSRYEDEEYRAEEMGKRAAMFDKFFSCDYTGTRYYVQSLSTDPADDPLWHQRQAWWNNWLAEQVAEQMKHCTVDDRSPFAKLGDLLKAKLTLR